MNILFLTKKTAASPEQPDDWMAVTGIELRRRNHKVYFSGESDSQPDQTYPGQVLERFPLPRRGKRSLLHVFKLARFLKNHRIDIVVSEPGENGFLLGLAKKLAGVPVLLTRSISRPSSRKLSLRGPHPKFYNGIITNCQAVKNHYTRLCRNPADWVKVIPGGAQPRFNLLKDRSYILKKYEIPDRHPVIGMFGPIIQQKQYSIFLEVANNILREWKDAVFVIAGDGPLRSSVQKYAFELGVIDNLYLYTEPSSWQELITVCDLVLDTSRDSSAMDMVMEEMKYGKTVVSFAVDGIEELLISEKTGALVPPNDIYLMSQKVGELLRAPEKCAAMGEAAREHLLRNFPFTKMIDEVESYFSSILSFEKGEKNGEENQGTRR